MALHYDLTKIENSDTLCFDRVAADEVTSEMKTGLTEWAIEEDGSAKRMAPITSTLIHACMFVDLRGITEKNAAEFYARIHLWEVVYGTFLRSKHTTDEDEIDREGTGWIEMVDGTAYRIVDRPITVEDIRAHIGLTCNVADKPRRSWATNFAINQLKTFEGKYNA